MRTKTIIIFFSAWLALGPLGFSNGLNLNSLGSRALAMGGAFVGLADDYSAIFWNPAGLANLKSRVVGFYGTDIIPSGTYSLTVPPPYGPGSVVDAQTRTKHYLGGMAVYAQPINPELVAAIGIYTPAGLGSSWDGTQLAYLSNGSTSIDWSSKIGLVTIAPTLALKISDVFSVGASFNINYGMFSTNMYAGAFPISADTIVDLGQYEESVTGWGVGATIGVLVKPSSAFSLGATFRTASTVSFSGTAKILALSYLGYAGESDLDRDVTWPMWIAGGVAVHPLDNLTVTADVQYTNWKSLDRLTAAYKDPVWNYLMTSTGNNVTPLEWKDAVQVRFGAEYVFRSGLAVRAGFYSDPTPAPDQTMNILLPSYDFSVLTLGAGYTVGPLRIDGGLEYLIGKDRSVDVLKTNPLSPSYDASYDRAIPGSYGMKIIVPSLSLTYRFD
jgi:long-chain fatty acid transport protein